MHSYYHELFLRGMPHLIKWMKRSPAPSTSGGSRGGRPVSRPCDEPNFYEISANYPIPDYYRTDERRSIVRREMRRIGGYFVSASNANRSISQHEGQNPANASAPDNGYLVFDSQQCDLTIKDNSEGKSDITMEDSLWNESHEQEFQPPSESDWESLWDALSNSDVEIHSNKQQIPEYELKFFIAEPMNME